MIEDNTGRLTAGRGRSIIAQGVTGGEEMGKGKFVMGVVLVVLACAAPLARADTIAGVVPDQPAGTHAPRAVTALAGASLDYGGGPVMHSNRTHVIFWNPSNFHLTWDPGYKDAIIAFLQNVAADSHKPGNVYALTGQYTDTLGGRAIYDSTYAGALDDTTPATNDCTLPAPPPVSTGPTLPDGVTGWPLCLSATALRTEVVNVVNATHLPIGLGDIYFVVTPDGFGSCDDLGPDHCSLGGFGTTAAPLKYPFCGFHTFHAMSGTDLLWADIPYNHVPGHCRTGGPTPNGTADESISAMSHEHNETITDPLINAWVNIDNVNGNEENGDLCASTVGPPLGGSSGTTAYNAVIGSGHYFIQAEWSNEDANGSTDPLVGCKAADENDALSFTPPTSVPPGSPVALSAAATDPDGSITSYSWDFGDGSPAEAGASATHTFASTGVYQVTLTTTNVAGLLQSLTHPLIIDRPPTAAFTAGRGHPIAAVAVKFNGAGSSDSDGSVASYRWSFGDGSTATGPTATNVFLAPGTYRVKLTVYDNLGVSSSASHTVNVAPFPSVKPKFKSGLLRISVNGGGTLIVGGKRTVVRKAGTVKVAVPLTGAQRHILRRRHVLKLKLTIVFRPRTGPTVATRIAVTLHG